MLFSKFALFTACVAPLIAAQVQLNVTLETTGDELNTVLLNLGFASVESLVDANTTSAEVVSDAENGGVEERSVKSCSLAVSFLRVSPRWCCVSY
jgi:hypothetical protein